MVTRLLFFSFVLFLLGCTSPVSVDPNSPFISIRPPSDTDAIALDEDKVWVGGKEGVSAIERQTLGVTPFQESLPYTRALMVDKAGVLWIGYDGGVVHGKDGMYEHFTTNDGLPDLAVNALLQTKQGTILAGTPKGIARWDGQQFIPYLSVQQGLIIDDARVLFEDSRGYLWVGSYSAPAGGISIIKDSSVQTFSTQTGLPHNDITSFAEAVDGTIWAGTGFIDRGGAAQFTLEGNTWSLTKTITQQDGLAGPKIRSIFNDNKGVLWMGFEVEGLTRPEGSGWKLFTTKDGLPDNEIKTMIQDEEGRMWLGTRNGVGVSKNTKFE